MGTAATTTEVGGQAGASVGAAAAASAAVATAVTAAPAAVLHPVVGVVTGTADVTAGVAQGVVHSTAGDVLAGSRVETTQTMVRILARGVAVLAAAVTDAGGAGSTTPGTATGRSGRSVLVH